MSSTVIDLGDLKPHPEGSVLGRIVSQKIEDVGARARAAPLERYRDVPATDRDLRTALSGATRRPALIAEVKRRSPSRGPLRPDLAVSEVAAIYERHAAAISVVTDTPFFDGSLELLREVRARVTRPVLLKDFVLSEYQILEGRAHGADGLLLMASVLTPSALTRLLGVARGLGMEALVEVHDEAELAEVLATEARVIGVNNRDLSNLSIDRDRFLRLARGVGPERLLVAESGLSSRADVERVRDVAQAVLIGTAFMESKDVEARVVELGW